MSRIVTWIALAAATGCEAPSFYPEDLEPLEPGAGDLACSVGPGVDGELTVTSAVDVDLLVYLVDSACLEQYAGTVAPGETITWSPAAATVWQVREADLTAVELIRVPDGAPVSVTVTELAP